MRSSSDGASGACPRRRSRSMHDSSGLVVLKSTFMTNVWLPGQVMTACCGTKYLRHGLHAFATRDRRKNMSRTASSRRATCTVKSRSGVAWSSTNTAIALRLLIPSAYSFRKIPRRPRLRQRTATVVRHRSRVGASADCTSRNPSRLACRSRLSRLRFAEAACHGCASPKPPVTAALRRSRLSRLRFAEAACHGCASRKPPVTAALRGSRLSRLRFAEAARHGRASPKPPVMVALRQAACRSRVG